MAISKTYNPREVENKWYAYWMQRGFFRSKPNPNKKPFAVVIPPPNVTGVLHMGHMLNNTIQDVLVRRARMQGKEACWVPGTDHASIATEAKVVAMLKEKGIAKKDLTRAEFLRYAWEWKEKYGGIILDQLKKLGASCDWDRTRFTMEEDLSDAVMDVFIDLHKKGYIYRGSRMVNWDPVGLTAVSDEEVYHKEVDSQLFYVAYAIQGSEEKMTIATTRPETILADTAICVNPHDERYQHLIGKQVIIPFSGKKIPVIADEYVDKDFGTGCLKVTPAHDLNDYNLGLKHGLEIVDLFNPDGTLNEKGGNYAGLDRFAARKKFAADLKEAGYLVKTENIKNKVGCSERTHAVIEPRISMQWFCKMEEMAKPALAHVMNDDIKLHPAKFKNTYRHWMENVRDWCISRQLWWGHRIPAWYLPDGTFVVAKTEEDALEKLRVQGSAFRVGDLRQDEDVLDTWFSSWLWPISVFDGFKNPENEDIRYYYPTDDLVTAPEILFFWVARMIMAGYEYRHQMPFKNVYLTGIVRDKLGRKMSKSLGNSPEPLELIEKYGADGVRMGMLLSSPAGNDLPFDEKLCEQGRNFSNKIWNAYRLVSGWELDDTQMNQASAVGIEWFKARFAQVLLELEDFYGKYRLSDALNTVYNLIWDDFCSVYLEIAKPEYGKPLSKKVYEETIAIFEDLLKVLHPFMPFISEELWHELRQRGEKDCLIVAAYPTAAALATSQFQVLKEFELAFEVVTGVRAIRNTKQIPLKNALELRVRANSEDVYKKFGGVVQRLANVSAILFVKDQQDKCLSFLAKTDEIFVPIGELLDENKEKEALQKELAYLEGFLESVNKKLSNERFVQNAKPEIIQNERNKKADAEVKIKALTEQLSVIG
ncbi:MAG TPA: valine--tRNA ligase [Cytophagales bacterium]|nr:valine--tRNA ligase [Cytophagales bacterium]